LSEEGIKLIVKKSPISGSGIARVHVGILEEVKGIEETKPVLVESKETARVLRLVADDIMERGRISLRQKDMNKLRVSEGEEVTLSPVKGVDKLLKRFSFMG
jgi:arginine/ornithine N-succinyltransferase beta subunit